MLETSTRSSLVSTISASVIAAAGLVLATAVVLWASGTFGLSTATAAGLWKAFEVGGWALSAALIVFSGGTSAAIYAAMRGFAARMGKQAAERAFIL